MLQAVIDRNKKIARFFGPGTFEAREEIKKLGLASWRGDVKEWEVRHFSISRDQLEALFPGIVVEELAAADANDQPTSVGNGTSSVPNSLVPNGMSVGELFAKIHAVLRNHFAGTVFVYGVLSQVKHLPNGPVYLDLAEVERPDQRINCTIRSHVEKVCEKLHAAGLKLEPQLQVMFEATVSLNPRNGSISLIIIRIVHEYTLAKLAAQRELTNERLKKEGLFLRNKELSLPFLPRRLGIITSAGGTVIHDFRSSLDEAQFGFELLWYPVAVQGAEAKGSILEAVRMFSTLKVDAVLIFRGGGSQAELSVFNDYDVARAVCLCPHPVLAAIGHQEDRSSVQDVSFRELGVPKDIGRFFADIISNYRRTVAEAKKALLAYGEGRVEHLLQSVEVFSNAFLGLLRKHIESTEEKLTRLQKAIPLAGEQALTQTGRRFLERAQPLAALAVAAFRQEVLRFRGLASIGREISQFVEKMEMRLENFAKIFETADPAAQLRRGFAIVRSSPSGDIVTQGAALTKGMEIEIEFQDTRRLGEIK